MNKNVLVTGGAGYIGSHACKALFQNGYVPITFDNLSTGHRDFVKWGPFHKGDLLDQEDLEEVFNKFEIFSVMHFAASASVSESIANPIKYYRQNLQGTVNLLEIFVSKGGKQFIFSSSCATYGESKSENIIETSEQVPINPYGFSKLAIEKLIVDLERIHKFNFAILRYFNAAGADLDSELGERHASETHVIPLLIKAALSGNQFTIFGNDYQTLDGTAIRDFVHVTDIAVAHLRALEFTRMKSSNVVCNLGTGIGVSVLELVTHVERISEQIKINFEDRRAGDPARLVASNEMSKELLNMKYTNSSLTTIFDTALNWHKKELENF